MPEAPWEWRGKPYTDPDIFVPSRYESLMGRYRKWREGRLLKSFLDRTEPGERLLDCPSGSGRLCAAFRRRGLNVVAADLSVEMLRYARRKSGVEDVVYVRLRGHQLPLEGNSVDWVFSFALMKHLSPDLQLATLAEFERVAKKGVAASFATPNPLSFSRWWWRYRDRDEPSFPIPEQWLRVGAERMDLEVMRVGRIVPWLGLEALYLFTSGTAQQRR